jgi:hypothetical protein
MFDTTSQIRLGSVANCLRCVIPANATVEGFRLEALFVGRVPDCATPKEKPDTNLSAFYAIPRSRMTPEADLLTYETTSRARGIAQ